MTGTYRTKLPQPTKKGSGWPNASTRPRRRRSSVFHKHSFKWIAAQVGKEVVDGKITDADITSILLVCECGDVITRVIQGAWDVETFRLANQNVMSRPITA
jgi:hypothetical protein